MTTEQPKQWKIAGRVPGRCAVRIECGGYLVAEGRAVAGPWKNAEANAKRIVQAVNSFDLLVGFAKIALPVLSALDQNKLLSGKDMDSVRLGKEAIKKAEGGN